MTMKRFYSITEHDDGTVDVYPRPVLHPATIPNGGTDYDISVLAVRGIDPNDPRFGGDLEGHIRANYDAWCGLGETILL